MSKEEDETILIGGQSNMQTKAVSDASQNHPKAKLICLDNSLLSDKQQGLEILLDDSEHTIGRSSDNTVAIDFARLSRHHARIYPSNGKWVIEDLDSVNGVLINEALRKESILRDGDNVKIGAIPFVFNYTKPEGVDLNIEEVDDDDEEKTMFIGGIGRETDKIVNTLSKVAEENSVSESGDDGVIEKKQARKSTRDSSEKKSKPIFLLLALLLAVVGYFVYATFMSPNGDKAVIVHKKRVTSFSDKYESTSGTLNSKTLQAQLGILARIQDDIDKAAQPFPENQKFKKLLFKVTFFQIERQLALHTMNGDVEKMVPILDEAIRLIYYLTTQNSFSGGDLALIGEDRTAMHTMREILANSDKFKGDAKELRKEALDMLDILTFTNDIVFIKHFLQKHPKVVVSKINRPSQQDLSDFSTVRQRFINQKKRSVINKMLSVWYPIFENIVKQVDEEELQILDRWQKQIK
jgi:hypothetical protein